MRRTFRFRPRFGGLATGAIALGALLIVAGLLLDGSTRTLAWIGGGVGVVLGALYLRSPAWRLAVHVDDEAIEVTSRGDRRFRVIWSDVREVVASPSTRTCFLDGGDPARSLLVPGDGAPAPYAIEHGDELFQAIVERAPRDRVREVELLERA